MTEDFVIEHIRERLRRLASQHDMLTCEHMLEAADEIERLERHIKDLRELREYDRREMERLRSQLNAYREPKP